MRRRDLFALAAIALVAAGYTIGIVWNRAQHSGAIGNYDNYALYYPNLLYARDSLRLGEGVLWNRFQNCGQPFFAIAATAILYPPHAVYLFFAPHTGLFVLTALHFFLAGAFAYALFRQLDLSTSAALAGSVAFELGGISLSLAFWSQTLVGHFLWIPAAMAVCERILRRPSADAGLLLGLVLSIQFLAGYPPITVFTYQLIALRFLWELATGDRSAFLAKLGALALGLVLPLGLIAVQLFPSLELAGQSLRNRTLTPQEIRPPALSISFEQFRRGLGGTNGWGSVVVMVPAALAAVGLVERSTRRLTVFYLFVGLAYAALAFENPVSAVYSHLPFGKSFRMPQRFLWLTGFAVSVLVALGVQAAALAEPRRWSRAAAIVAASACGIAVMAFLPSSPLGVVPWALAAATVVALVLAAATGGANIFAICALPTLVLANQLFIAALQFYGYLPDDSPIYAFREAFAQLRQRVTLQDRIYPYSSPRHFGLQRKSPSIFRIPSIGDYESQTSERFVQLYVRMINGAPMKTINEFYYQVGEIPKNRPLFNLLAARYVVLHTKTFFWPESMRDLELRQRGGGVAVFENPNALPRAYFVPRVEVVADPAELLERLASTEHDPRKTALVETAPPGDLGSDAATGSAAIIEDRGEELRVRVGASAPGFLALTDQLYPGWEATVNGRSEPVVRANYAFRLVRVPQGESTVVFRYRPRSFRLGLALSCATLVLLLGYVAIRLARRPRSSLTTPRRG